MARQRNTGDDSLELLLDTICNMFGGIVLIAILLAVLSQQSGRQARPDPKTPQATEQEVKEQTARLAFLSNELVRVEQALEAQNKKAAPVPGVTAEELDRIRSEIERLGIACETERQRQKTLDSEIDRLTKEIAEMNSRRTAMQTRNVRVPSAKSVDKRTVFAVVKGGSLYVLSDMSGSHGPGMRPFNPAICTERRGTVSGTRALQLALRADAVGQPVPAANEAVSGPFGELLAHTDVQQELVSLIVYADSFAAFNRIKDRLVAKGIGYNWRPLKDGDAIPPIVDGKPEEL